MPMFLSLGDQCCMNCKLCEYDEHFGYHCPSASTRISNQLLVCCEKYTSKGKKKSVSNKEEDKTNMIVSPFKEVCVPRTVFNKDYWKVGDAYVIKEKSTKRQITSPKFYVLEEVVEMSYVRMDNGVTLSIEEFNNGYFEVINHISLDHACSKSIAEE